MYNVTFILFEYIDYPLSINIKDNNYEFFIFIYSSMKLNIDDNSYSYII